MSGAMDAESLQVDSLRVWVHETPSKLVGIALDASAGSTEALSWALDYILVPGKDKAVLITVMPTSVTVSGQPGFHVSASDVQGETIQKKKEGIALLEKYKAMCEVRNVHADMRVMIGDAKLAICEAAHEAKVDALVVGSRGHGTLRRLVLGSVSEYCVNNSECPVIVVRPKAAGHHK